MRGERVVGRRPVVWHHAFLDVLALGLAARDQTAAAVGLAHMAGPILVLGMFCQFDARGHAAGPALALIVEAKLIDRPRVDPAQPDPARSDLGLIARAAFCNPGNGGG